MAQKGNTFGQVLTDRIIQVVKRVDATPYKMYGQPASPVLEGESPYYESAAVREFTGIWPIGTTKTVTAVGDQTSTYVVTNRFFNIPYSASTRQCLVIGQELVAVLC